MTSVLAMPPSQIESTRNSIDIHRRQIDRKRLNIPNKGHIDELGNHGHIVSRLLKAFGSPLCAFGVVIKTLDTLMDIVDTQPHLVNQLVENDICLLLVSWLGQTKRNTSSEIPIKILKCISQFLIYGSEHDEEISQLFVDGFLFENLGLIFSIFKEENYVLLYTGRILRSLAEAQHVYDDQPRASHLLESISMTLLDRNLGATILFDFCYGVKDWDRKYLCKKTKPILQKIMKKLSSSEDYVRPKTIRQFLTLVIVSSYPTPDDVNEVTESLYLSKFMWTDRRREISSLVDVTLQCFLDHSSNPRLLRCTCAALTVLLHQYYSFMADDRSILLYSLHRPICEAMIKVLTAPAGQSLKLTLAVLQVFVLLFPQGCLFRKQLLRSEFIRITHDESASSLGCGCGKLPPSGVHIIVSEQTSDGDSPLQPQLLHKWLPLLEAARDRCQQIRQQDFRLFVQKSTTFSPASLRDGNFPSISLIFSNLYVSNRRVEKKTRAAMEEVFFSKKICDHLASFL
jgi:hypothetical protein